MNLYENWTKATGNLKWGVQRVFHDVFSLASESQTTLIYGADYKDGNPCLVNTVGTMLSATKGQGGTGLPTQHFGEVVSLFDQINRDLESKGVNDKPGYVSPMAAEVFLRYFAPLKEKPIDAAVDDALQGEAFANNVYRERSDEDIARDIMSAFSSPSPCEVDLIASNDNDLDFYHVRGLGSQES